MERSVAQGAVGAASTLLLLGLLTGCADPITVVPEPDPDPFLGEWQLLAEVPAGHTLGQLVLDRSRGILVGLSAEAGVIHTLELGAEGWSVFPGFAAQTLYFDPVAQRVRAVSAYYRVDEWSEGWVQVRPANQGGFGYLPRSDFTATHDDAREVLLVFGGWVSSYPTDHTFEWRDGEAGGLIEPPTRPVPRMQHAAAFHPGRGTVMIHGGWGTMMGTADHIGNDLWEFDGTTWRQLQPDHALPFARRHHLVYVDHLEAMLLVTPGEVLSFAEESWDTTGLELPVATVVNIVYDTVGERLIVASPAEIWEFRFEGS